jgi:2-oxo-4-hydroxy-4-carboxy--5-ureidoimidazoline (OHCU) decarboxylase
VTDHPTIEQLDAMSEGEFETAVGPLFEGAPQFLRRLAAARPFGSSKRMFDRALEIAMAMPEEEQIELVDSHPRLGAPPGSVSEMSFVEQGYDRDAADQAAEAERDRVDEELERLNDEYEARFAFRYCVFVAGRPRAELVKELQAALGRSREEELVRALADVVAIAEARYGGLRAGAKA